MDNKQLTDETDKQEIDLERRRALSRLGLGLSAARTATRAGRRRVRRLAQRQQNRNRVGG